MQKVLTAAQMREVDRRTTEEYGIPSIILMENAAHAVARVITEKLGGSVRGKLIIILCGKGNNGGDGSALARILWEEGARCLVYLFGSVNETAGDARVNFEALKQISAAQRGFVNLQGTYLKLTEIKDVKEYIRSVAPLKDEDVYVDALLGTGFTGKLRGDVAEMVKILDSYRRGYRKSTIVSIDLPSGVDADSADLDSDVSDDLVEAHLRVHNAVRPHTTVTFTAPKLGNVCPPASRVSDELIVAQIGSPPELLESISSNLFLAQRSDAKDFLVRSRFRSNSYKNKRGHALLIAGSKDFTGAAVLCGNAAIRSGVGLVTLACPADAKAEIASRLLPEVILSTVESADLADHVSKADAIAVGCGLDANDAKIEETVRNIVTNRSVPVVIDASALGFYSPFETQAENRPVAEAPTPFLRKEGSPLILTPHEGEFMRLLGTEDKEAIKDRVEAVRDFATKNNVILVLKGERVLIGAPDGRVVVNPTGNSGLGKAGNGDTLTGILIGFIAQAVQMKIDIVETLVAACYVAGMAGDVAEKKYGKRVMTASDVRECLAEVFNTLGAH